MMYDNNVTTSEVYRLLRDIDERHTHQLSEIEKQVRLTNGRTTHLEFRMDAHDSQIKEISSRVGSNITLPPEVNELIQIARDMRGAAKFGKMVWGFIYGLIGALVPIALWWLSNMRHPQH